MFRNFVSNNNFTIWALNHYLSVLREPYFRFLETEKTLQLSMAGGNTSWQTYHCFEFRHLPQQPVFVKSVQGLASYCVNRSFVYPLIESCHQQIERFTNCLLGQAKNTRNIYFCNH